MQTNKNNINREIILETTLKLIDENGSINRVTLRDIGKRLGCAHTNLYNYFKGLDDILWEALGQALLKMIDYCGGNLEEKSSEEDLYLLLSKLIDYSMDHPGLYRLIWIDNLKGSPSPHVINLLERPSILFNSLLKKSTSNKLSKEKLILTGEIMHSYLHGELCKWINNRSVITNREEIKIKMLNNLKYMYKLMTDPIADACILKK